jgi:2'-5' RNA ligase
VAAGERIRLFCALQLPDDAIAPLVAWQREHLSGGRIVPPGNLHLTLAFLGHRPAADLPGVVDALRRAAAAAEPVELEAGRYRETRSVGMVLFEDVGGAGARLAADLAERLARRGLYRPEERPWLPHATVLRFRERPRLTPPSPALPRLRAVRAAVYASTLGPAGARYEALETVALGGR